MKVFGIPAEGSREWLAIHLTSSLHVWLIYKRIKSDEQALADINDTDHARALNLLGQEFYDRFWEDTTTRVRDTKVS